MAGFQSEITRYDEAGIRVMGISADSVEKLRRFSDKMELTYPLLSDPEKKVIGKFGALGMKKLYGREYEGIIRSTVILDENNEVAHVFPKVSPAGHAKEVLRTLGIEAAE